MSGGKKLKVSVVAIDRAKVEADNTYNKCVQQRTLIDSQTRTMLSSWESPLGDALLQQRDTPSIGISNFYNRIRNYSDYLAEASKTHSSTETANKQNESKNANQFRF